MSHVLVQTCDFPLAVLGRSTVCRMCVRGTGGNGGGGGGGGGGFLSQQKQQRRRTGRAAPAAAHKTEDGSFFDAIYVYAEKKEVELERRSAVELKVHARRSRIESSSTSSKDRV